jgi:peptidoglycan/LPS O-acetylase OafA/YrhL
VIGALAVVAHHVGFATGVNVSDSPWAGWLARLDVGVAVFFVLSGFLLFRPWAHARATAQELPGTRTYLWRRALRILPAYWVTVIVCMLVVPRNAGSSPTDWLRQFTLTQIYETYGLKNALGHTWSLATEAVFYLLLPFVAALALRGKRRAGRPVAILAVSAVITATWIVLLGTGVLSTGLHTTWLPSYAIWFGAGMALASVHVSLSNGYLPRWRWVDDLGRAPLACWAIAVAVLGIATTSLAGPRNLTEPSASQFGFKVVLYATVAVLVVLPLAFGPETRAKAVFGSGSARWLGFVSYGLFLWHPLVLEMIYEITDRPDFSGGFLETYLITAGGGLVLASLSYYLVEKPFLRLGHRRRRRPPGNSSESQSATPVATAAS